MKRLAIIPVLALTVALVAAPVSAATSSPDADDYVAGVTVDGKDITDDVELDAYYNDDVEDRVLEGIDDLVDTIDDNNNINFYLLPDGKGGTIEDEMQAALDGYGSTMKPSDFNQENSFLFDLSYIPNGTYQEIDGEIIITMDLEKYCKDYDIDISFADSFIIIIHNNDTDAWEVVTPTKNANGLYTFKVSSLSPFIVTAGSRSTIPTATPTAAPTATATATPAAKAETKSPQTGESAGIYLLLISAGLAVAGIVCVKRAMKPSEK